MDSALFTKLAEKKKTIAIVGLGYVGLPLACLLARKFRVVGFDIDPSRVDELRTGYDRTREVHEKESLLNENIAYTDNPSCLGESPVIIVTVPTPIDSFKIPDLSPLLSASKTIAEYMKKGTIVVYESTVYPGCTENECRNVLETSGLKYKVDFHLAYSPERVNPGDREHTIDRIAKVVSASSPEVREVVAGIYGSVIQADIHLAPNIATAEAAKVIENTQRDLNVALINELAMLFDRMGLDTQDVLAAAGTKWNFLRFTPGLVGGHCIGVDPYYLTHKATGLGFHPQLILAGRRINDSMGTFVAQKTLKLILNHSQSSNRDIRVAVLGMTFKENVPDLRNTKVIDVVQTLETFGVKVYCIDPVCHAEEFEKEYGRTLTKWEELPLCDAMIGAVRHTEFVTSLSWDSIRAKLSPAKILVDLKCIFDRQEAVKHGVRLWRL